MSVKYPNYVNLTSSSEEQPNGRTPSPPPRKKSLSPPQAPSESISSKSTHYTSTSSPSDSPTPTYFASPPKLTPSGLNDQGVFDSALFKFRMTYAQNFTLVVSWKLLRGDTNWQEIEMSKFYKTKADASKKLKPSDTTLFNISDSVHGNFNLSEEADDSEAEEVREVRPMGRDKAKKKAPSSYVPSEFSDGAAPALFDDLLADKWKNVHSGIFSKKMKDLTSFFDMKQRQMELQEKKYTHRQEGIELHVPNNSTLLTRKKIKHKKGHIFSIIIFNKHFRTEKTTKNR
ncbi:ribonuclease H-like domain-containing protein [Tanacetum coccineum]